MFWSEVIDVYIRIYGHIMLFWCSQRFTCMVPWYYSPQNRSCTNMLRWCCFARGLILTSACIWWVVWNVLFKGSCTHTVFKGNLKINVILVKTVCLRKHFVTLFKWYYLRHFFIVSSRSICWTLFCGWLGGAARPAPGAERRLYNVSKNLL